MVDPAKMEIITIFWIVDQILYVKLTKMKIVEI